MSSFSILTPRSSLSKDLILELISVRENKYTVMIEKFFFALQNNNNINAQRLNIWVFFFGLKLTRLIFFVP